MFPYSLNAAYPAIVGRCADRVTCEMEFYRPIIESYRAFANEAAPASFAEYGYEFLALGALFRRYAGTALRTSSLRLYALSLTVTLRSSALCKAPADYVRGKFLLKLLCGAPLAEPTLPALKKLVRYLRATADYEKEARRLRGWYDFFKERSNFVPEAIEFADWFAKEAEGSLGAFTPHTEAFADTRALEREGKEDAHLVSRTAAEYHLAMVGAELMNRGMRERYLRTKRKAILVPRCIRKHTDACKAIGDRCTGCDKECAVARLAASVDATVILVSHQSGAFASGAVEEYRNDLGVVGVACLANVIAGGYTAKEKRLPAQCVILNHPGCAHWRNVTTPTSVDREELARRL